MRRLLAIALLFAACGAPEPPKQVEAEKAAAPPPPTAEQAKELIANASDFGEYQFTNAAATIPLKRFAMREDQLATAKALAAAKWIRFDGDEVVVLKKDDKRFLVRPNGTLDVVPLAKKELVSVDALRSVPENRIAADITWRWIANDVGKAFTTGPLHQRYTTDQKAAVTLYFDGTAWSVLRIDPR
jgi:hypothetical protein